MALDLNAAAASLYGPAQPAQSEPPAQSRPSSPTTPDTQSAAPQHNPATAFYDDPADQLDHTGLDRLHASTQRSIIEAGVERFGLEPEAARDSAMAWGRVFREFDLAPDESAQLAAIALPFMDGSVDVDLLDLTNRSRAALTAEYGARADQVLDAARQLIAKHTQLASLLEQTGLGSHPAVVTAIARKAYALKRAGKL
ncbi:MAG: hypothetical protein JNJ71_10860 [Rubrivivax sp.]|nr:hypothetical protein [Rubrivivax sp.]